jgi:hypothetical protein
MREFDQRIQSGHYRPESCILSYELVASPGQNPNVTSRKPRHDQRQLTGVGALPDAGALAALKALRGQARANPHAAPALLELAREKNQTNPKKCARTVT